MRGQELNLRTVQYPHPLGWLRRYSTVGLPALALLVLGYSVCMFFAPRAVFGKLKLLVVISGLLLFCLLAITYLFFRDYRLPGYYLHVVSVPVSALFWGTAAFVFTPRPVQAAAYVWLSAGVLVLGVFNLFYLRRRRDLFARRDWKTTVFSKEDWQTVNTPTAKHALQPGKVR